MMTKYKHAIYSRIVNALLFRGQTTTMLPWNMFAETSRGAVECTCCTLVVPNGDVYYDAYYRQGTAYAMKKTLCLECAAALMGVPTAHVDGKAPWFDSGRVGV